MRSYSIYGIMRDMSALSLLDAISYVGETTLGPGEGKRSRPPLTPTPPHSSTRQRSRTLRAEIKRKLRLLSPRKGFELAEAWLGNKDQMAVFKAADFGTLQAMNRALDKELDQ